MPTQSMTGNFHSVVLKASTPRFTNRVVCTNMMQETCHGRRMVNTRASGVVVLLSVTKACAMMRLTDPLKPATDAKTTSLVDKSLNHQDTSLLLVLSIKQQHATSGCSHAEDDTKHAPCSRTCQAYVKQGAARVLFVGSRDTLFEQLAGSRPNLCSSLNKGRKAKITMNLMQLKTM